jgi:hypothetical protein
MSASGESPPIVSSIEDVVAKPETSVVVRPEAAVAAAAADADEEPKEVQDDTGYESGQSGQHVVKVISDNVVSSTDQS